MKSVFLVITPCISEENIASILKVSEQGKQETSSKWEQLAA
jgi:hypothetical protein